MKKILALTTLALAAGAASAAAVNGTLTLDSWAFAPPVVAKVTLNPPGWFNSQSQTVAMGAIDATWLPNGGVSGLDDESFRVFCIELFVNAGNFGQSINYTLNEAPAFGPLSQPLTALQQTRLNNLFIKEAQANTPNDRITSAATQLAVWEIMYDSTASNFGDLTAGFVAIDLGQNTGAGEFYSAAAEGARTMAENLLNGIDSYLAPAGWSTSIVSFNNGANKPGKQDFISVTVNSGGGCDLGEDCEVPAPGTLALATLSLGLLGLRRRTPKVQAIK